MQTLKEKRAHLGLTQARLARLMGVHVQLWVKWERSEQRITAAPDRLLDVLSMLKTDHPAVYKKLIKRYLDN